jgi:hypothetical protein
VSRLQPECVPTTPAKSRYTNSTADCFLDAIGAERIPDPTTAGDFCRRFSPHHIQRLQEAFDEVRWDVWKEQDEAFFAQATIDMDGTIVQTTGQTEVGMDISNRRCDQENVLAQLSQCRALHAPVDNLESNWAFMVMTALSWSLKAWIALSIPVTGRWAVKHQQERRIVLRMEFKRFVEQFIRLPAPVIRSGRQMTIRLLSWTESLEIFNRWLCFALE